MLNQTHLEITGYFGITILCSKTLILTSWGKSILSVKVVNKIDKCNNNNKTPFHSH